MRCGSQKSGGTSGNDVRHSDGGQNTFDDDATNHAAGDRSEFGGSVGSDTLVLQNVMLHQLQSGLQLEQGSNVRAMITEQSGAYVIQFAYAGSNIPIQDVSGTFSLNGSEPRFHGVGKLVIPKA